jgi:hypothetical protein
MMSEDNRLNQLSRQEGIRFANKRGLINSTIAAQASTDALIKNATPFALQDANTYATQGRANQDAVNTFARDANSAEYNKESQSLGFKNNLALTSYSNMLQIDQQDRQNIFVTGENKTDREFKSSEQEKLNAFNAGQQDKQNKFVSAESIVDRTWKGGEQDRQNLFSSGENKTDREFRSSEQDRQNAVVRENQQTAHGYQLEEIKAQTDGQIKIAASQVDQKYQAQYLDSASNLQKSFLEQQTAILNNPNLKSEAQITNALKVARQNFESSISWMQGLYAQGGVAINTAKFPQVQSATQPGVAEAAAADSEQQAENNYLGIPGARPRDISPPLHGGGTYTVDVDNNTGLPRRYS